MSETNRINILYLFTNILRNSPRPIYYLIHVTECPPRSLGSLSTHLSRSIGDPRCLSINLNAVGTLKLSLICEWCPLAEWQESEVDNSSLLLYYTPTHRPSRIAGGTCSSTPAGMIPHPTGDSNGSCSASAGATPVERHRYSMLLCDSDDESEAAAVTESHSAVSAVKGLKACACVQCERLSDAERGAAIVRLWVQNRRLSSAKCICG